MNVAAQAPQPTIRAVIFDMDGLMLDTERLAQQAWQRAGAELGYPLPDELYLQAIGRTAAATEVLLRNGFGADFPFPEIYARKQQYYHAALEQPIPTKPGLFELLALVETLGLPKAVATSTARPLALKKLTAAGLLTHFSVIVCGDEIAHGKPAPDIFLAAATKLAIDPAHCLVLEDSPAGIQAAHAAGMTPIHVPDLIAPSPETRRLAYRVVTSLHAVGPLLTQWADVFSKAVDQ